jgi:hypothetical protein
LKQLENYQAGMATPFPSIRSKARQEQTKSPLCFKFCLGFVCSKIRDFLGKRWRLQYFSEILLETSGDPKAQHPRAPRLRLAEMHVRVNAVRLI